MIRNSNLELLEYTKNQLINMSRKDTKKRYYIRTSIDVHEFTVDRVNMMDLINGSKDLIIYFNVKDYVVTLCLVDFVSYLQKEYKSKKPGTKVNDVVSSALSKSLRKSDVQVKCTCPDFRYRFAYVATKKKFGFDTNETRPAKITNPRNKGSMCKHLIRVLNAPSLWKPKVVTRVVRSIRIESGIVTGEYERM